MTDDAEYATSFPITPDGDRRGKRGIGAERWRSVSAGKVQWMHPDAQAEIKRLQPYHRGDQYTGDPLWKLDLLNNIDKHRLVHVVAVEMQGMHIVAKSRWENIANASTFRMVGVGGSTKRIEGRTEVMRWSDNRIPIDPSKEMRMNPSPEVDIVFDSTVPLVGGEPVVGELWEIDDHIVSHVLPPLVGFLK
jgi:hypothetical protein